MAISRQEAGLRILEAACRIHGGDAGPTKDAALADVEAASWKTAAQVRRFHEVLCYLRALPDDPSVLERVKALLAAFPLRPDVRRHRAALADSGIAGTDLHLGFYAPMARWVATRWPDRLEIDWAAVSNPDLLRDRMYLLGLEAETPGLDHADLSAREWIERMKHPEEADGAFVVRSFAALPGDPHLPNVLLDELELPLVLRGGIDTPSKTRAHLPGGSVTWREGPLRRERPDLRRGIRRPPLSIRALSLREGKAVIDLAHEAMLTRDRALDAFAGGDPRDVTLVDCGDGLEFAVVGSKPSWRMLLEGVHGWLTLRNGVAVGYVLSASLFRSSEIAYNVFDTWRGGDAAWVYGRVLATAHALFGSDTFTIYPYQLGHGNREGLESGSWWFYHKLGFRPRDPDVVDVMERELARMARNAKHRSSIATLEKLARANVYYEHGRHRKTVIGTFPLDRLGLAVTDRLAARYGSARTRAEPQLADEMAALLGAGAWRRFPTGEREAWRRWSPLLAALPGLDRWSVAERRALVKVVRAKGGRGERAYVHLFDAHPRLTKALVRLARSG